MSVDPGQQQGPPPVVQEDPSLGVNAMLAAIRNAAQKASMATSAAEAKDFGAAALAFAQTIITLDPSRLAGGDTPAARAAATPSQPVTPQLPKTADGRPRLPTVKDGNKNGVIGG